MNVNREISTDSVLISEQYTHHAHPRESWPTKQANSTFKVRVACRIVLLITKEMAHIAGDRISFHNERRRPVLHFRQIAMYVCHVGLQFSLSEIGLAFGRDRTTVSYSCRVIEDRRDDRIFDEFVASVERLANSVVKAAEVGGDG